MTLASGGLGWVMAGPGAAARPRHHRGRAPGVRAAPGRASRAGRARDELKELADTFDDMLERLDPAFASQRRFVANASHELRTPLTVMRTAIDVTLAKPARTPEQLEAMAAGCASPRTRPRADRRAAHAGHQRPGHRAQRAGSTWPAAEDALEAAAPASGRSRAASRPRWIPRRRPATRICLSG